MIDQQLTRSAITCDDVDDAFRQTNLVADLGKKQSGEWRKLGRLHHDSVTHCDGGRDLPRQHEQWKIPGNDLSHYAYGLVLGQFLVHELCPTRVMIEMPCDQRDVDVA